MADRAVQGVPEEPGKERKMKERTCGECEYFNGDLGMCELLKVDTEADDEACADVVKEGYENER